MSKDFKTKLNNLVDLGNLDLDLLKDKNLIPENKKPETKEEGASGKSNDLPKNDFKDLNSYLRSRNREKSLAMKKDVKELVDDLIEHNRQQTVNTVNYKDQTTVEEISKKRKHDYVGNMVYDGRYPGGIAPNNKNGYNPIKKDENFFPKKDEKDEKGILGKDFDKKVAKAGADARKKIDEKIKESIAEVNEDFDKKTKHINLEIRDRLLNEIKSHKLDLVHLYSLEKDGTIDSDHVNINRVKESLNKAEIKLKEVEQRLNFDQDDLSGLDKEEETSHIDKKVDYFYRKEQLENSVEEEINELKEKIISNKRNIDYFIKKDGENHENVINEKNNLKKNELRLKELENWEDFDANDSYLEKEKREKVGKNLEKTITGVEKELEKIDKGGKNRPEKEILDLKKSLSGFRNFFKKLRQKPKKEKKIPDNKKEKIKKTTDTKRVKDIKPDIEEKVDKLKVKENENKKERKLLLDKLEKIKERRREIKKILEQIDTLKVDTKLS